jgi:hypothetical protein
MSDPKARSHFEKARLDTVDEGVIEVLDGHKHLSHAIEEDLRTLEQSVRNIRDISFRRRSVYLWRVWQQCAHEMLGQLRRLSAKFRYGSRFPERALSNGADRIQKG